VVENEQDGDIGII